MFLATLYGRYLGDGYDFFIGPGVGGVSAESEKTDAAPNFKVKLESGSMACGVTGGRVYFGKAVSAGIGLTGFYCATGNYKKTTTTTALVASDATVPEKASMAGGFLFLFLEWNEERTLF